MLFWIERAATVDSVCLLFVLLTLAFQFVLKFLLLHSKNEMKTKQKQKHTEPAFIFKIFAQIKSNEEEDDD